MKNILLIYATCLTLLTGVMAVEPIVEPEKAPSNDTNDKLPIINEEQAQKLAKAACGGIVRIPRDSPVECLEESDSYVVTFIDSNAKNDPEPDYSGYSGYHAVVTVKRKGGTIEQIRAPYGQIIDDNKGAPINPRDALKLARDAVKDVVIPKDCPIEFQIDHENYTIMFVERMKRAMPASGYYAGAVVNKKSGDVLPLAPQ